MKNRPIFYSGLIIFALALLSACSSSPAAEQRKELREMAAYYPSPDLSPDEVVEIQINALRLNDEKNKGIEIVFRFASPSNKRATGPLPRFISMIKEGPYSPMLNHENAAFAPLELIGDQAVQIVALSDGEGTSYTYVFVLSREKDCAGCWMTDAVFLQSVDTEMRTA